MAAMLIHLDRVFDLATVDYTRRGCSSHQASPPQSFNVGVAALPVSAARSCHLVFLGLLTFPPRVSWTTLMW